MGKKPPIRVALDLETTGLHAEQDAILEVAAIKFQGATILDTMETLVAPGRSIPYRVQRLTGITPQQLPGVPSFDSIAQKLQLFIGEYPIVGHSIPFDVSFLRRRGLAHNNPLIDTFELATVLLPSLPSYSLGSVAEHLGVPVAQERHRAMVDTVLAMQVFLALHQRLQAVDISLLKDLANLDAPRNWPLLAFFRQELRDRQEQDGLYHGSHRGSLGEQFAAQLGIDPRILTFAVARAAETESAPVAPPVEQVSVPALETLEQVHTLVETASGEAEQLTHRGYQAARIAVREALETRSPLLVEVTIGANDYTPVLLATLEWLAETPAAASAATPRRLIITCSSSQSARRLVDNIVPRLQASLKSHMPVAYLAEHDGYLCLHRWFGAALRRTSGELTAEQARGLAKLGLWAQQTVTGERSELTLLPQEIAAWERICSGVERLPAADGRSGSSFARCVYRQRGYCFIDRAEERARDAQIVVTTHAGLLDDLSSERSLLGAIPHRLILDADLLEEETARWSSGELNQIHLIEMLNTVGAELPDGRYQGLLALAAPTVRENGPGGISTTLTVSKAELDARMLLWFQALRQARVSVENLFTTLGHLLEESQRSGSTGGRERGKGDAPGRSHGGRGGERMDQPLRLGNSMRNMECWMDVEGAWQQAAQRLQAVIDLTREAEKMVLTAGRNRHRLSAGGGEDGSLASELAALARRLQEQKRFGEQAIGLAERDMVYWLRMPPSLPPAAQQMAQQRQVGAATQVSENAPVLHGQLVQTPALLKRLLLTANAGTVLAGAALSVDGSFSFYRGRFGLDQDKDSYPALSVVTEHHEQTLLYVPNDVPEPNAPQYQRNLDEAIMQLATALEGQLLVLFTSHASLRSSYSFVKSALEAQNILLLGHGVDGSPRQLWHIFQEQERVVLFGTGNFWDGTDEIGRVPACILVTRLPMPVLNDPPLAARAEQSSDQLHQLTVPFAALRIRRALNRLAWSGTKRNAIVLFDRRVISKEYGSMILHSLPRCSMRQADASHMPEIILDWLTTTGSWE
ncbi:MAG: exonuclease domain-containing protein [Chloroflexota bacterium]|nr:exonuclease domain-containing protein [Chloroflexota bacterium]